MRTLAREGDRRALVRRLRTIAPDSSARWGRMTSHEMICHVGDAFRMAIGQKAVRRSDNVATRTIVKWIALYVPLAWPAGIPTVGEIDPARGGTRPGDFRADVAAVEALLELFMNRRDAMKDRPHPLFGRMSEGAWLRWAYLHTDHHLRQFGA